MAWYRAGNGFWKRHNRDQPHTAVVFKRQHSKKEDIIQLEENTTLDKRIELSSVLHQRLYLDPLIGFRDETSRARAPLLHMLPHTAESVHCCVRYFSLAFRDYNAILCGRLRLFFSMRGITKTWHELSAKLKNVFPNCLKSSICVQRAMPERILMNNTLRNALLKMGFI